MALERWREKQPVEILTPSQLVEKTRFELKGKFGKVAVAEPSALLTETQRVAEGEGFGFLEPLYLPQTEFRKHSRYPRGWVKPESWYWKQIKAGRVASNAAALPGLWTLFDRSRRPDYQGGKQMFEDDQGLGEMLAVLRQAGRIAVSDFVKHVPAASRFAVSSDEQDQAVFPELAKALRLIEKIAEGKAVIRTPKAIEFNHAGNLRYPYLGQANTAEWYSDKLRGDERLFGSSANNGGLAHVHYFWSDVHLDFIAFRPLVVFPSKT